MNSSKRLLLALIPLVLMVGAIVGVFIGRFTMGPTTFKFKDETKFDYVLSLISREYVDPIDIDSLIEKSIPDILASLDPHSVYLPIEELQAANDELAGSFSGVGVSFQILNDTVTIVEIVNNGPAEKVGLQAGDRILEANGKKMTGSEITNQDVFKTLRGDKGTKVEMKIKRNGIDKPITYDVIRGDVPVNSVDSKYMIEDDIGYIKVSSFAQNTAAEFMQALGELKNKGAKKFIVDLRGNPGGFMDQAIDMVNEFLPAGAGIVYSKGRRLSNNNTKAVADGTGSFQNTPITVLIDETSASASEIFAGAIQDNDRGLVVGRRSFGKGLVQNQILLPDSSAIRLTVARYYTPSGRCIQKEYKRGNDGKYELDILERYNHGEFYNADSIKFDKTQAFKTVGGRTVYGGGGIMPDIFVPQDTTGFTSYYLNVMNQGLLQRFSFNLTDSYRGLLKGVNDIDRLLRVIPADETLLQNFVDYAADNGEPARWYYINQSRDLLLEQLKAVIARDALGYSEMMQILNRKDPIVLKAIEELKSGKTKIQPQK